MDQKTDKHQLSAEQQQSYESACAKINPERLKQAIYDVSSDASHKTAFATSSALASSIAVPVAILPSTSM